MLYLLQRREPNTNATKDTYKTLQKAAKIPHHRLRSLDGDVIPKLFYHRECYQRFTLKHDLEKIVQQETEREEFEKFLLNEIQFETMKEVGL